MALTFQRAVRDGLVVLPLFLIAVMVAVVCLVNPAERPFSVGDRSISYPLATAEAYPRPRVFLHSELLPVLLMMIWGWRRKFSGRELGYTINAFAMGIISSALIVEVLKKVVGRLRPDFLARCKPVTDSLTGLVTCSGNPHVIMQGRQSFASSHASDAVAGWGFLILFVYGTLSTRSRTNPWILCLLMLFSVPALVISVSRITDNRHHTEDVIGGGLIGLGTAVLWYRVYFYPPKGHTTSSTSTTKDVQPRGAPYSVLDPEVAAQAATAKYEV
ncbi:phosphatidic acid phosphatase type 2/haloperoxidase [Blastocladiella britannica]|nr:phosphatidic acid phosphatase type 2/haloperoxidase [Blastocladiella britannica]